MKRSLGGEIGAILKRHLGQHAERVPTRTIPHVVVRIAAVFMAEYRPVAADLGYIQKVPNDKARRLLGPQPRPTEAAVIAAAESMIAKSLLKS